MNNISELSAAMQKRAKDIIKETNIIGIWESVGATVNIVGSVRMGLIMKHRDIDLHIYSSPLNISDSFAAMARLAENPSIEHIEYTNLIDTDEACIEWHARYRDRDNELWKFDMIHILKGSFYDGYMENVADRIMQALTPETKEAILRIKYDTPDDENIAGIEYYRAVISGGIRNYEEFARWRKDNPLIGVLNWMP